jgi:hypothetical protein
VSNSQQRINDSSPGTQNAAGVNESPADPNDAPVENLASSSNVLVQRHSLTIAELAALGASNNSTPVFQ